MSTKPGCSLEVLFARDAPVGAIFRRGPTRWVRLIKWNTETDRFQPGQWFHGRVFPERSDLSPDGELLIYFAGDFKYHHESKGTWTAISKPPYFTALKFWPKGNCWGGGGVFVDNRTAFVDGQLFQIPRPRRAHARRALNLGKSSWRMRDELNGWAIIETVRGKEWRFTKPQPRGGDAIIEIVAGRKGSTHRVLDANRNVLIDLSGKTTIFAWDRSGRLIHASAGELLATTFRRKRAETKTLADFGPMTFETVPPPAKALRW